MPTALTAFRASNLLRKCSVRNRRAGGDFSQFAPDAALKYSASRLDGDLVDRFEVTGKITADRVPEAVGIVSRLKLESVPAVVHAQRGAACVIHSRPNRWHAAFRHRLPQAVIRRWAFLSGRSTKAEYQAQRLSGYRHPLHCFEHKFVQTRAALRDVIEQLIFHAALPEFLDVVEHAFYRFFRGKLAK